MLVTTEAFDALYEQAIVGNPAQPGYKQIAIPGDNWGECLGACSDASRNRIYLFGATHQGAPLSIPFVSSQFQFRPWVTAIDQHGVFDPTFNGGTPLVLPMGLGTTTGTDSEAAWGVVDSTGLLTLGCSYNTSNVSVGQGAVVQINPDGSLHTQFNGTGFKTYIQAGGSAALETVRVAVQTQGANAGKILLCVPQDLGSGNVRLLLSRHLPTGALDTVGFNSPNGFQASQFVSGKATRSGALLLDNSDNIYVGCGNDAVTGQTGGFFVELYGPNGLPMTTFGGLGDNSNGARVTFPQSGTCSISSLALDAAGRLVCCGQAPYNVAGNGQLALAWLNPTTGALVTTVGTGGISLFDYHSIYQPTWGPSAMLLLSDGEVVAVGETVGNVPGQGFSDGGQFVTARYSPGAPTTEVWKTEAPAIVSSSNAGYGAGALGYPGTPPTFILGTGHIMNDVLSPRRAVAFVWKLTLLGALATDFG